MSGDAHVRICESLGVQFPPSHSTVCDDPGSSTIWAHRPTALIIEVSGAGAGPSWRLVTSARTTEFTCHSDVPIRSSDLV